MRKIKYPALAGLAILLLLAGWHGCETRRTYDFVCFASAKSFIAAQFSETVHRYDMIEKRYYTEVEFWEEDASDIWIVYTRNDSLLDWNCPDRVIHRSVYGFYYPEYPPVTRRFSGYHFDGYQKRFRVDCWAETHFGKINISPKHYLNVLARMKEGRAIKIKSWYGFFARADVE